MRQRTNNVQDKGRTTPPKKMIEEQARNIDRYFTVNQKTHEKVLNPQQL